MGNSKKPPLLGMPRSLKVADLAAKQGFVAKNDTEKKNVRDLLRKQSQMEIVGASLNVEPPRGQTLIQGGMEVDDSWASLPVTAIHFYERNPRKANNEAYDELKESIRVNLILQPLTVTRRPDSTHYILYAGGNTRLQAIKELWEETQDPKFRETRVIIKSWRGEAAVLLAHMAENTQRNDMTFWDRANGILEIKRQLEDEGGKPLSHREFEAELKKFGIQTDVRTISMYRFAVERLPDLGPWLSGLSIRVLQPRLNLMLKLANHHDLEEPEFFADIVSPAARTLADSIQGGEASFTPDALVAVCEGSLCTQLNIERHDLGKMLTALERFPELDLEGLRRICKPAVPPSGGSNAGHGGARHGADSPATPRAPVEESVQPASSQPAVTVSATLPSQIDTEPTASQREDTGRMPELVPVMGKEGLYELIYGLLSASGIGDCFHPEPAMPNGYYMGFPKDGPLDLKDQAQNRQSAWWVLAMVSGQFDRGTCHANLPDGNEWRSLILEEGVEGTLDGLELAIQHNIGGQAEFLPLPWLLDANNKVAGLCLKVLAEVRKEAEGGKASA